MRGYDGYMGMGKSKVCLSDREGSGVKKLKGSDGGWAKKTLRIPFPLLLINTHTHTYTHSAGK